MKIKADFITNSSSSSFCCWGINLRKKEIKENEKFLKIMYQECQNYMGQEEESNLPLYLDFEEFKNQPFYNIFGWFPDDDLLSWCDRDNTIIIGGTFEGMPDDITLREYKQKIIDQLNFYGFDTKEIKYIEVAWYDG